MRFIHALSFLLLLLSCYVPCFVFHCWLPMLFLCNFLYSFLYRAFAFYPTLFLYALLHPPLTASFLAAYHK